MQFPRVWEDDANSNDSTKVMLHTLRDQLGRTPRGEIPECDNTDRTIVTWKGREDQSHCPPPAWSHSWQSPCSSLSYISDWRSGFFCLKSKLWIFRKEEINSLNLLLVSHDAGVSLPIVPHLDEPVLITGHRYVWVQAVQGGVVILQIFVPEANPV